MDPDEGGGTPHRRSRRIQSLGPLPQSSPSLQNTHNDNQNSTGSVRVSEASLSQYDSAHNTHDPNSSLVVIPPNASSNTITSSDPPEDHTGISYQTQSANPSISSSSTPRRTTYHTVLMSIPVYIHHSSNQIIKLQHQFQHIHYHHQNTFQSTNSMLLRPPLTGWKTT